MTIDTVKKPQNQNKTPFINKEELKSQCSGRWLEIIPAIDSRFSEAASKAGEHVPCPIGTGDKDGFCFKEESAIDGMAFSNSGGGFGDGIAVLQWAGHDFREVLVKINDYIGNNKKPIEKTIPTKKKKGPAKDIVKRIISECQESNDLMNEYLSSRGLDNIPGLSRKDLLFHPNLEYLEKENGSYTNYGKHPAIVAIQRKTGEKAIQGIKKIYLDSSGEKLNIKNKNNKTINPKTFLKAVEEATGAVIRLGGGNHNSTKAIIGEGIETSLTGLNVFNGEIPCFATGTGAYLAKADLPKKLNKIFILVDKDRNKAGLNSANKLKEKLEKEGREVTLCIPPLAIPEEEKSIDWLDVLNQKGTQPLLDIIDPPPPPKPEIKEALELDQLEKHFKILGYNHGSYYFIGSKQQQVVELKAGSLRGAHVMQLAPLDVWKQNFPKHDKDGNIIAVKWDEVENYIINEAANTGVYNPDKIRGRGYWYDNNRLVRHTGNGLIVDGEKKSLLSHKSEFVYEKSVKIKTTKTEPLTHSEFLELKEAVEAIYWKDKQSSVLFLGWCFLAPFCGALKWRPHLGISGAKGCGKSDTAIPLMKAIIGRNNMILAEGDTSEAGIRQKLKSDGFPVVVDEVEQHDKKDAARVQRILQLARNASSEGEAETLKGTVSGNNLSYNVRSMFAYAAINIQLEQAADESRTTVLDIDLKEVTPESKARFSKIKKLLYKMETENWSEKIIAYVEANFNRLQKNIDFIGDYIASDQSDARKGKQYGAMLGAYALFDMQATEINSQTAIMYLKYANVGVYTADQDSQGGDEEKCLESIMAVQMKVDEYKSLTLTISEAIEILSTNDTARLASIENHNAGEFGAEGDGKRVLRSILKRYGIIYQQKHESLHHEKGEGFYIANNNQTLKTALQNTPHASWKSILKRTKGAKATGAISFGTKLKSRTLFIPMDEET